MCEDLERFRQSLWTADAMACHTSWQDYDYYLASCYQTPWGCSSVGQAEQLLEYLSSGYDSLHQHSVQPFYGCCEEGAQPVIASETFNYIGDQQDDELERYELQYFGVSVDTTPPHATLCMHLLALFASVQLDMLHFIGAQFAFVYSPMQLLCFLVGSNIFRLASMFTTFSRVLCNGASFRKCWSHMQLSTKSSFRKMQNIVLLSRQRYTSFHVHWAAVLDRLIDDTLFRILRAMLCPCRSCLRRFIEEDTGATFDEPNQHPQNGYTTFKSMRQRQKKEWRQDFTSSVYQDDRASEPQPTVPVQHERSVRIRPSNPAHMRRILKAGGHLPDIVQYSSDPTLIFNR